MPKAPPLAGNCAEPLRLLQHAGNGAHVHVRHGCVVSGRRADRISGSEGPGPPSSSGIELERDCHASRGGRCEMPSASSRSCRIRWTRLRESMPRMPAHILAAISIITASVDLTM